MMKLDWLLRNRGDRVIYIGDNRSVGLHLARIMGAMRLYSLHDDPRAGHCLFRNEALALCVDFLSFVEVVHHQHEFEWRIAGRHGIMGGPKDTGRRLAFTLNDVESVYVDDASDIPVIQAAVQAKSIRDGFRARCPE